MPQFIDDADLDAQVGRTLIAALAGATDLGEAIATVGRCVPGDYDRWYDEWAATARVAQAAGDAALGDGHTVSARGAFLRASEYWRQAFFFLRHDLDDERLQAAWRHHRTTFRAAVPLLPGDTVIDEIPFDGASMTAYLFRPSHDGQLRPTIIAPCGYDSTAEAGYAATAHFALERGYNCLIFEGPGQGGMLYEHRYPMRPDFETVLTPAVDWLVAQEGVDPGALVLVGRSFGGYLGPRGVSGEPRIAALVADPAQYDFVSRMVGRLFSEDDWEKVLAADPEMDAQLQGLLDGPRNLEWYGARLATMGASSVGEFLRMQPAYTLEGRVDQIRCPVLMTQGEGDFAASGEALVAQLGDRGELKQFTAAEGAGGHCEGLGAALWASYTFDWIDRQLGRAG